jgi:hypothetical protein
VATNDKHKVPTTTELVGSLSGAYMSASERLGRETLAERKVMWEMRMSTLASTISDVSGAPEWATLAQKHDTEASRLQREISQKINRGALNIVKSHAEALTPDTLKPPMYGPVELRELQRANGFGTDWHEPDNGGINAIVWGTKLDNAGFAAHPYAPEQHHNEITVYLTKDDAVIGCINLATLLALAADNHRFDDVPAQRISFDIGHVLA